MSKKLFWWGCFKVLPGWWLNLPTSCYLWWQPSPPPSSQFPNDGRDSASLGDCQGFQGTPNLRQGAWSNRVGQAHLDELHRGLTKCRDLWGRLFLHVSIRNVGYSHAGLRREMELPDKYSDDRGSGDNPYFVGDSGANGPAHLRLPLRRILPWLSCPTQERWDWGFSTPGFSPSGVYHLWLAQRGTGQRPIQELADHTN